MNDITRLFREMPDDRLFEAVSEISRRDWTDMLGNCCRQIAKDVCNLKQIDYDNLSAEDLVMIQIPILKEASRRWYVQHMRDDYHNS